MGSSNMLSEISSTTFGSDNCSMDVPNPNLDEQNFDNLNFNEFNEARRSGADASSNNGDTPDILLPDSLTNPLKPKLGDFDDSNSIPHDVETLKRRILLERQEDVKFAQLCSDKMSRLNSYIESIDGEIQKLQALKREYQAEFNALARVYEALRPLRNN